MLVHLYKIEELWYDRYYWLGFPKNADSSTTFADSKFTNSQTIRIFLQIVIRGEMRKHFVWTLDVFLWASPKEIEVNPPPSFRSEASLIVRPSTFQYINRAPKILHYASPNLTISSQPKEANLWSFRLIHRSEFSDLWYFYLLQALTMRTNSFRDDIILENTRTQNDAVNNTRCDPSFQNPKQQQHTSHIESL